MNLDTVYRKDKSGKLRMWSVEARGNTVIVTHGVEGGKLQTKETVVKPKNIGKANETSEVQQAINEAQSKWNERVNRDCYRTLDRIDEPDAYVMPMLAKDATKVFKQVRFDEGVVAGSRKLDGVRAPYRPELGKLQTREGLFYDAPQHIIEQLKGISLPLDGELYLHGTPLNEILGAARKWNKELTDQLEFHAFDIAIPNLTFVERHKMLSDLFYKDGLIAMPHLKIVGYEKATRENYIDLHNKYVMEGYEGEMLRHIDSLYEFGERADGLFKFKVFKEAEFIVIGVAEDKDGGAVLGLQTEAGHCFSSRPKGTLAYRMSLLDGECIGQKATVRYFAMTSTATPVPSFPVVVAVGDKK